MPEIEVPLVDAVCFAGLAELVREQACTAQQS
jgi:hypothetical protein